MAKKKSKKSLSNSGKFRLRTVKPAKLSFWLPCLLFFIFSATLYYPSLDYDFILDDKIVITDNQYTKQGIEGIPEHLSSDVFTGFFGEKKDLLVGGRYRPLSLIVFSVIYEYWQLDPTPYHLTNILFYGGVCCLIFTLLLVFTPKKYQSKHWWMGVPFIATLFYLFHPIHIEAVANIKGLDELLTMFFSLLTWLLAVITYKRKSWLWAIPMASSFFLALLAKENALTFLAVIPLSFYIFSKPKRHDLLLLISPLLLSAAIYLGIRYQVLGYFLSPGIEMNDIMNNPFFGLSAIERFTTVMFTWLKYLQLLIFPHPLVHDYYPYAIPIMELGDWRVLSSILLHIALAVIAFWGSIKRKFIPFWIAFYFITFSIVSNLLFTVGTFMNERFIFIPSLAFSVILAIFIGYYVRKWIPQKQLSTLVVGALILGLITAYTMKNYDRIPDWETHLSLNRSAVEEYPTSARSTLFYGTALFNKSLTLTDREEKLKTLREAEEWVNKSIAIFPQLGNKNTRDYTYFNSFKMKAGIAAEIHKLTRDHEYLLDQFLFVAIEKPHLSYIPEYLRYMGNRMGADPVLIDFYHTLAFENLAVKKKNYQFAVAYLDLGLEIAPDNALLNYDKGRILQAVGREGEAQNYLNKAARLDPSLIN